MNKKHILPLVYSILLSSWGCIGEQPSQSQQQDQSFPYATNDIKQQIAAKVFQVKEPIAPDFFETINYFPIMQKVLKEGYNVFGTDPKQQVFWYYLMRMRILILQSTSSQPTDDLGIGMEYLNMLGAPARKFLEQNKEEGVKIFSDVIRYEETYPYDIAQQIEEIEKITVETLPQKAYLLNINFPSEADWEQAKKELSPEDFAKLQEEYKVSPEQLEKTKQQALEQLKEFPREAVSKARQHVLQLFKADLEMLQSNKSPEEFIAQKNRENNITEYDIGFTAPLNYPAALFFAEFVLDEKNDDNRLGVNPFNAIEYGDWTFTKHRISLGDAKPLPHALDLMWYSAAENKSYLLETKLPLEKMAQIAFSQEDDHTTEFVFGLAPFGTVALWAQDPNTHEISLLGSFQAKEYPLAFEDFNRRIQSPATNWEEYRNELLEQRPEAKQYLAEHGLPAADVFQQFNNVYNTGIRVEFPNANTQLESFSITYFNGETEKLSAASAPVSKRAKIKNVTLMYKEDNTYDFASYLFVSNQEAQDNKISHQAYQTVFADNPDQPGEIVLSFDKEKKAWKMDVSANGKTQNIPLEELRFKNKFEEYRSPVYYQPQALWQGTKPAAPEAKPVITPEKRNETLAQAILKNDDNLFFQMLEEGADIHYQTPNQQTMLSLAVSYGKDKFVQKLIELGADVNEREPASGYTPLMLACQIQNLSIVNQLIAAGADVNAPRRLYNQDLAENPLSMALETKDEGIINALQAAGAKEPPQQQEEPAATENQGQPEADGFSPLAMAVASSDTPRAKELIQAGADVNTKIPGVGSVLLFACSTGNAQAAQALIQAGADVNAIGDGGYTPLMLACSQGNLEIAKMLVAAGADVNAQHIMNGQPTGLNPLQMAAAGGFNDLAQFLKDSGAH